MILNLEGISCNKHALLTFALLADKLYKNEGDYKWAVSD
jgi:hypothetical protein